MINIIFTGLISIEERFKKSINDFVLLRNEDKVNQIILSTWIGELNNYNGLRSFLDEHNITVIEAIPPTQCNGSILYQMKSLHVGLDAIKDQSLMVFKTRPDLYIDKDALLDIMNLDLTIDVNNKHIFEKKVWIPWFEISKPFYLADECIYSTYNDMKKLVNYDMIYDSYYDIDAGISHIRRFIHPFMDTYPVLKYYLKYLARTGHGTIKRFEISDYLIKNKTYNEFLEFYYLILKDYFEIGLNNNLEYIEFRKWSTNQKNITVHNIKEAINPKYSFDTTKGQVYDYNLKWINTILVTDKDLYNTSINIDEDQLKKINTRSTKILHVLHMKQNTIKSKIIRKLKSVLRVK